MPKAPAASVDSHPQRQYIIESILADHSSRSIARSLTPPLSHVTIACYRKYVVKPALRSSALITKALKANGVTDSDLIAPGNIGVLTSRLLSANEYWEHMGKTWDRIDSGLDEAQKFQVKGKFSPTWDGITAAHDHLRLTAELTGQLNTGASVNAQIIVYGPREQRPDQGPGDAIDVPVVPSNE